MLTSSLAQMRRLGQQVLLDHFQLLTATRSLDRYGRESISYAVAATVKGQLSGVSGSERDLLEGLTDSGVTNLETAKLTLPWGTTLSTGQLVRKVGSGKVWDVAMVVTDETMGAYVVALLTREATTDG